MQAMKSDNKVEDAPQVRGCELLSFAPDGLRVLHLHATAIALYGFKMWRQAHEYEEVARKLRHSTKDVASLIVARMTMSSSALLPVRHP